MAGSPPPNPQQDYQNQGGPQQAPQGYPQQQQQGGHQQPQHNPNAPYGVHPRTGAPYSDKQKVLAGALQLAWLVCGIPGIGRFYTGHIGIGVAQLILGCTGIGQIWSGIDGLIMMTSEDVTDAEGRPLRPN